MPTIKIIVPAQGLAEGKSQVRIEAEGYSGESCIAGMGKLMKSLGEVVNATPTNDMYKTPDQNVLASS